MKSIQQQLLLWLLGSILLATTLAGWGIYLAARQEANKLFDYHLQQAALSLPFSLDESAGYNETELSEEIVIQVWNPQDKLIYTSSSGFAMPRYKQQGFQTVEAFGENWRIYSETRRKNFIQIAQPESVRESLATNLVLRSLAPFLLLIPVMLLLVGVTVQRNLRPLQNMSLAIQQRSPTDLQPLLTEHVPVELATITLALNDLLARLESALAAQRAFVADAAHELRSPLTALKLQLQLAERAKTEAQRTHALAKLSDRINRAVHLVEQMLTLARYEVAPDIGNGETVPLTVLLEQAVADHSASAERRHIQLVVERPEPGLSVRGNPQSLQVLLGNLLENALHATPEGGVVRLQAYQEEGKPRLCVTDNGVGIPVEERQRVFDRFYRCLGNETPGTGLGLAIVQHIAKQHQANILLEANPEGRGTRIDIIFPAANA